MSDWTDDTVAALEAKVKELEAALKQSDLKREGLRAEMERMKLSAGDHGLYWDAGIGHWRR